MKNTKDENVKLFEGYATCGGYKFKFEHLENPDGYQETLLDKCHYSDRVNYSSIEEEMKCLDIAKEVYDKEMTRRKELYEDYQLELFPYIKEKLEVDEISKINSFVSLCSSENFAKCFRKAVDKYYFYKLNIHFFGLDIPVSSLDDAFSSIVLEMTGRKKGISEDEFVSYINNFIDEAFSKFSEVDKAVEKREAMRLSGCGGEYSFDYEPAVNLIRTYNPKKSDYEWLTAGEALSKGNVF